ncbi:MAG: hypothetical protein ACYC3G_00200 [Minisyncoccota bacterium]
MSLIESPKKELSPEEKIAAIERNIYVEIEKEIIGKYAPLLMNKGKSKIESQTEWIALNAENYRLIFNTEKDKIINMYKEDPNKAIEYIETQLEAAIA